MQETKHMWVFFLNIGAHLEMHQGQELYPCVRTYLQRTLSVSPWSQEMQLHTGNSTTSMSNIHGNLIHTCAKLREIRECVQKIHG